MSDLELRAEVINNLVGKALYEARIKKGMSRKDLGQHVKLSQQQIEKYEKGKNRMSVGILMVFSELLEVPLSKLVNMEEIDYSVADLSSHEYAMMQKNREKLLKYFMKIPDLGNQGLLCDIAKLFSKHWQ